MKYILLCTLALAGCQTTPEVQTKCLKVGSETGTLTLCPLPAGIICIEKDGQLSCFQLQDPVLRAEK
jgi:hypothetical protein